MTSFSRFRFSDDVVFKAVVHRIHDTFDRFPFSRRNEVTGRVPVELFRRGPICVNERLKHIYIYLLKSEGFVSVRGSSVKVCGGGTTARKPSFADQKRRSNL